MTVTDGPPSGRPDTPAAPLGLPALGMFYVLERLAERSRSAPIEASAEYLAGRCGVSRRTITDRLGELEAAGVIARVPRPREITQTIILRRP